MPFSPSDISGLQFWLRADDLDAAYNDGDQIATWEDRQNNHDFTGPATTNWRPLFKTNIRNGMPAAKFDGVDEYLEGGNLDALFPSAATLFIVYQPATTDNQYVLARNNNTDTWFRHPSGTGSDDGYLGIFRTTRVANYPASVPNSGWHTYAIKSSSSTYQAYLDGVAQTAQSASYDDGAGYFYIGGSPSDPQSQERWFDGYIFEVIAYDSALSSTDIANLHEYAAILWNGQITGLVLTVTPSLPAGTVGTTQQLTGVALSATPSLPAGTVATGTSIVGVVLTVTPTQPAGTLRFTKIYGVHLATTPVLPVGSVRAAFLTGVALSATPTLPAGAIRFTRVYGAALTTSPSLPVGVVRYDQDVTGVVILASPSLPMGKLTYIHPIRDVSQVWTIDLYDEDG